MDHALMVKNADFSANKLDTRTVITPRPCTAIELNMESITFNHLGQTATLTASVTPSNTTDTVVWISANPQIATVINGIVTQTGVGHTTITAKCGARTAICAVYATNVLTFTVTRQTAVRSGNISLGYDYATVYAADVNYGAVYSTTVTPYKLNNDSSGVSGSLYPILLGGCAKTIEVEAPNTIYVNNWQVNAHTVCDYGAANPQTPGAALAKFISGDPSSYDRSHGEGNRTILVSEGADAVVLCLFHFRDALTDEEIAAVTITVKGDEST